MIFEPEYETLPQDRLDYLGKVLWARSRETHGGPPLENITFQVDRGKGLLDATSRLAHTPDADLLECCDLTAFSWMGFALTTSTMRLATRPRKSKRRLNL